VVVHCVRGGQRGMRRSMVETRNRQGIDVAGDFVASSSHRIGLYHSATSVGTRFGKNRRSWGELDRGSKCRKHVPHFSHSSANREPSP